MEKEEFEDMLLKSATQAMNMQKLEDQVEMLKEALEFYAQERHIREYSHGQMVMLEACECNEDDEGNSLPNTASSVLEKLNKM